jgi:hypothetical protein
MKWEWNFFSRLSHNRLRHVPDLLFANAASLLRL